MQVIRPRAEFRKEDVLVQREDGRHSSDSDHAA